MTDLSKVIKELEALGIHDVKNVVYNPSYEQLDNATILVCVHNPEP